MTFSTIWLRGGGGEKGGGTHKFSLLPLQNTISPNWNEKWEKYLDKTAPTSFNVSRSFFFLDKSNAGFLFLFFFCLFLWFCQVVGSSSFPSFFFFNFNFIIFFKKTLLDDFLCYFLKCPLSSLHNFKKNYSVLLFVLFKRNMMENLYKPYFQSNQKVFHPSTFPPSQLNTNKEN